MNNKQIKITLLSSMILLGGCMSTNDEMLSEMFNKVTIKTSDFDQSKRIKISNMTCTDSIRLELYQDSNQKRDDKVLLSVGTIEPNNIGDDNSLQFNIDGRFYEFSSISTLTNYDDVYYTNGVTGKFYNKTYIVNSKFIEKLALAKKISIRLHLLNNQYVEDICTPITSKKYQEKTGIKIEQSMLDESNKHLAQKGFKKFIELNKANNKE